MERIDGILSALAQTRPLVPMYIHLIIAALFPIYAGAHASLSRPSSAAKPKNAGRLGRGEDDDQEETVHEMEGLSPSDAIVFPVTAGLVLAGLYWLIKKYGAHVVNLVLGWYFAAIGVFSVAKLVNDGLALALTFALPTYFADKGVVWKVDGAERKVFRAGDHGPEGERRASPLPGVFGRLELPSLVTSQVWGVRAVARQKFAVKAYAKSVLAFEANLTILNVLCAFVGITAIAYNILVAKPWWLTNMQGFAVSYSALQFMSPTSFGTGSLILGGLFFYDIWAVFFTPLMVTVAKNLDQPIKLLFPRPGEPGVERTFSMLGLGDIVLPGLMIGLALRFDLFVFYLRKQSKSTKRESKTGDEQINKAAYVPVTGNWGSIFWTRRIPSDSLPVAIRGVKFSKPYFTASIVGYVIGMLATLGVMSVFQHAQPALLYLVPGVLLSLWGTALVRGELKEMWDFTEDLTGQAIEGEDSKVKETKKDESDVPPPSFWEKLKQGIFPTTAKSPVEKSDGMNKETGKSEKSTTDDKGDIAMKMEEKADPDLIFRLCIRRYSPALDESKDVDLTIAKTSEVDKERHTDSLHGENASTTASKSESGSDTASEDAVLVSRDFDGAAEDGPQHRLRRMKGRKVSRHEHDTI